MVSRYVAFKENSAVYLYKSPEKNKPKNKARQVLWGDYLEVDGAPIDGWYAVDWAPDSDKAATLYIPADDTTDSRPLEIVFVDVGQGDGAVLIVPGEEERVVVIDAGEGEEMLEFLRERFGSYGGGYDFHAAVITHADTDHYQGFTPIFAARTNSSPHRAAATDNGPLIGFKTVFHSGLMEGPKGSEFRRLGTPHTVDGIKYIGGLALDTPAVEEKFADPPAEKVPPYTEMITTALANEKIGGFAMVPAPALHKLDEHYYLPGFKRPTNPRKDDCWIEVVGPIVEWITPEDHNGESFPALRHLGSSYSVTKNGHSVILKLTIGDFTMLFGGDLNESAEKFALCAPIGRTDFPDPADERDDYDAMVKSGKKRYGADVMKVCHHGSSDVTDEFLKVVDPVVFVISSGDEEGHVHPRPDLLGRLGKHGRGKAPVLLSTELQRSTRPNESKTFIETTSQRLATLSPNTAPTKALIADLTKRFEQLGATNVTVSGSIYVKTDGARLITAFKKETGSSTDKWFYFHYEFENGELVAKDAQS